MPWVSVSAPIGTLAAVIGKLRLVYGVEALCMAAVLILISITPLVGQRPCQSTQPASTGGRWTWLLPLLPVLGVSLVATGILSLQQSALPLDLVRGGLQRPALSEGASGALIALQLSLLVILQWPVGRWLSERPPAFGLGLSLGSFSLGCLLLGLSSLISQGTGLVLLAFCRWPCSGSVSSDSNRGRYRRNTDGTSRSGHGPVLPVFCPKRHRSSPAGRNPVGPPGSRFLLWVVMAGACLIMLPTFRGCVRALEPMAPQALTMPELSDHGSTRRSML